MKQFCTVFGMLSLFGVLITPSAVFSAVHEKNAREVNSAWGRAYWKTCQGFNVGSDKPCIGPSKNNCKAQSWVTPRYGDEWGITLLVEVEAVAGGGRFCPVAIVGKNKNRGNAWTQYYFKDQNCVWLCREGYTGDRCEISNVSNVTSCNIKKLAQSDYDSIPRMDELNYGNRENEIPNWGANYYLGCGVHNGQEHDLIAAVSNWLPSGHGAFVRPYIVRAERSGWADMDSWIDIYPAAYTQYQQDNTPSQIACINGYKPNSAKNDCVPIKPELCEDAAFATMNYCDGWDTGNYETNKTQYTMSAKSTGANKCKYYTCKESGKALDKIGGNCIDCPTDYQIGIANGVCYTCPDGKFFDEKAGLGEGYCVEGKGLDQNTMKYGKGKSSQTPLEEQCWIKSAIPDEYKDCVTQGKIKLPKLLQTTLKEQVVIKADVIKK